MPRTLLIDTDTASDDAVALIMALNWREVEVAAITVVSGNVPVEQGVRNALYTVELCGKNTPVFRGAGRPLRREPEYAFFFHGGDGLGDRGFAPRRSRAREGHAVEAMIETIDSHPGLTVVTLGPLTNLALALEQAPGLVDRVERCVVMGGAACTIGNVTPSAEFNIWVDPEAARRVFHSGLPIEMVGWELCRRQANLSRGEMEQIRRLDNPLAHFTLDCNATALEANRRQSGDPGLGLPDPVAMSVALDPGVCTRQSRHYVEVETRSDLTRGMTVVDAFDVSGDERNLPRWQEVRAQQSGIKVCWEIDIPRWKEMLLAVLSGESRQGGPG